MPRRKLEQRNIRKLKRTGKGNTGSFSITVPIKLIRELKCLPAILQSNCGGARKAESSS